MRVQQILPVTALAFLLAGCLATGGGEEVVIDEPKPTQSSGASVEPPSPGTEPPSLGQAPQAPSLAPPPQPSELAMLPSTTPEPPASQPPPAPVPGGQGAAGGSIMLLSLFDGSAVSQELHQSDLIYAEHAGQESLEYYRSGTQASWQNPETGSAGSITPTRTYKRQDGIFCREFEQSVTAGGQTGRAVGTACRQPDATWRLARQ
jgi:surface antigen